MNRGDLLYCKNDLSYINDYYPKNIKIYEKGKVYEIINIQKGLLTIKSNRGIEKFDMNCNDLSYYFYKKDELRKMKLQSL